MLWREEPLHATVRFLGALFVRERLASKILAAVLQDLLDTPRGCSPPPAACVECALELLKAATGSSSLRRRGVRERLQRAAARLAAPLLELRTERGDFVYSPKTRRLVSEMAALFSPPQGPEV